MERQKRCNRDAATNTRLAVNDITCFALNAFNHFQPPSVHYYYGYDFHIRPCLADSQEVIFLRLSLGRLAREGILENWGVFWYPSDSIGSTV